MPIACWCKGHTIKVTRSPLLVVLFLAVGLWAQVAPDRSGVPSNQQVIAFLTQSIDWYRHRAMERQIATEPVDLTFLADNRPVAAQIVQLSFDFARADAAIVANSDSGKQQKSSSTDSGSPDLAQYLMWKNKAEVESRKATEQIDEIKAKLQHSRGADRRKWQAELDAAQSRVNVLQAGSASLEQLVASMRTFGVHGDGDIESSADELARTVPELSNPAAPPTQSPTSELAPITKPIGTGILSLSSEVSALTSKLRILGDEIGRTETLRQSSDALRTPLLNAISARFAQETQSNLQASSLAELQQQKARLDDLASAVKAISPAIVALDKQRVLLEAYTAQLNNWHVAVARENEKTWKELVLRLGAVLVVIGALLVIGAVARRAVRRHVQDPERRHIILMIQRVALWLMIVIITAFAFASDLGSMATFFGLLTAGVAVALQSVILSVVGYFVLVGRLGIRIGDRVQISGVTGDVSDIGWLQFQLREIDSQTQRPTGNVVTFSNSLVLASPATGLSRLDPALLKPQRSEAAAQGH